MQYALVNLTTGDVIAPFNTERAAMGQIYQFPADHQFRVMRLHSCAEHALSSIKGRANG